MSFSVLDRSAHTPDSPGDAVKLFAILAGIAILTYFISNVWLSGSMTVVGIVGYLFDAHLYIPIAVLIAVGITFINRLRLLGTTGTLQGEFGASVRDLALIGSGFFLYEFGRTLTRGSESSAVENAERLLRLQDRLHLPNEAHFQGWFLKHNWVMDRFNTIYSFMFLSTFIGVFIWMSFNAPAVYRTMRNAVGVATFAALAVFAMVPMAPPRLTEASGMIDSHARVGLAHGFVNQFAAMPSLHVGWMALAGWGLARAIGGWKGRAIGMVPPVLMMITVVVTGNHYWLDGVVGSLLCLLPAMSLDRWSTHQSMRRALPAPRPQPAYSLPLPAISGGDHSESDTRKRDREPIGVGRR